MGNAPHDPAYSNADDPPPYNYPPMDPQYIQAPPPQPTGIPQPVRQWKIQEGQPQPYGVRQVVTPYSITAPYGSPPLDLKQVFFEEGMISGSLLLLGAVTGYHFENMIASKIKAKGYGAITGALIANALGLGIASYVSSKDPKLALRTLGGASVPIIPIALGMAAKTPLKQTVIYSAGTFSLLALGYGIYKKNKHTQATGV